MHVCMSLNTTMNYYKLQSNTCYIVSTCIDGVGHILWLHNYSNIFNGRDWYNFSKTHGSKQPYNTICSKTYVGTYLLVQHFTAT